MVDEHELLFAFEMDVWGVGRGGGLRDIQL